MGTPKSSALTRFEMASKSVAIVGGIISAIAIVMALQAATSQRKIELRWKQANLAMDLLDSMWSDTQAFDALRMVDWDERTYQIRKDQEARIDVAEVEFSLDVQNNNDLSPEGIYIRESFDRLFYHMGRIERSVRTNLIVFDDVRGPLDYYVPMLRSRYGRVLEPYMRQLGFKDAIALLDRIPPWDAPQPRGTQSDSSDVTQRGG